MAFILGYYYKVKISINETRLKIVVLERHPGLQGTNELKLFKQIMAADVFW